MGFENNKNGNASFIARKYPTYRDDLFNRGAYRWIEGKQIDDETDGLWRIHDNLYDLNDFIDRHPGGKDWLQLTKGTDITEAFETHHLTSAAEKLLPKYLVRPAGKPRNIQITFHENGFYRTLKKKVSNQLHTLDRSKGINSKIILDVLLVTTIVTAILMARYRSIFFLFLSSASLAWLTITAHNFLHQKDNWRMYTFNISLMSYREWRIMHAMSHHLYTNSLLDLEISLYEPFLCWLPNAKIKNIFKRYGSWVYGPFLYFFVWKTQFVLRVLSSLRYSNKFYKEDMIPIILPLIMYYSGTADIPTTIIYWIGLLCLACFWFEIISVNAGHHHDSQLHDGDILPKNIDFGIFQLYTVMDRYEIKGSLFWVLTHFGDHLLHHMFPTLDHAVLPQLYSTLHETCREFEALYSENPWHKHITGQHKQLARITKIDLTKM